MALLVFDQTVTIGADGTALIADAASTHGIKFSATVPGAGTVTSLTATAPIVITPSPTTATGVISLVPTGALGVLTRLAQVVTTGSQATVVFSSIPATYSNLMVTFQGRDTSAAVASVVFKLFMNADTTAGNYQSQVLNAQVATVAAATGATSAAGGDIGFIPGTLTTADAVGAGTIFLHNYAGTTFYKTATAESMERATTIGSGMILIKHSFIWKSTAAIATLTFTAGGTAFLNGSVFTLYGMP